MLLVAEGKYAACKYIVPQKKELSVECESSFKIYRRYAKLKEFFVKGLRRRSLIVVVSAKHRKFFELLALFVG